MFHCKEWNDSECPHCQAHDEDALHVISYQASSASAKWQSSISNFKLLLDKHHMSPDVCRCAVSRLSAWCKDLPIPSLPGHYSDSLNQAWQEQTHIGWHQPLNGRMSCAWLTAQTEWWSHQSMEWEPSATKWCVQVIEALLEIQGNMWEHQNHCWHDPDHPFHGDLKTTTDDSIKCLYIEFSPNNCLCSDRHLFQHLCSVLVTRP